MSSVIRCKRTISFKPAKAPGAIIVSVSSQDINVSVTLKVESEDHEHANMVMDALVALVADPEVVRAIATGEGTQEEDPHGIS